MRIGVFSDSHGNIDSIIKGIKEIGHVDLILHAGDNYKDAIKISEEFDIDVVAVKGNTDHFVHEPSEKILEIAGKKIFLTHGHKYDVKRSITRIYYKALEVGADIIIFGHSHVPLYLKEDNMLFINPGSTSIPRGGSKASCGLLEIADEKIEYKLITIV